MNRNGFAYFLRLGGNKYSLYAKSKGGEDIPDPEVSLECKL